jgi:hypothetical protein
VLYTLLLGGQRHGPVDEIAGRGRPQRDVHGPVGAAVLGELAGAVERVDDPHPVGGEPGRVVAALLREHRVTGTQPRQLGHEQLVRSRSPAAFNAAGSAKPSASRSFISSTPARPANQAASSPSEEFPNETGAAKSAAPVIG